MNITKTHIKVKLGLKVSIKCAELQIIVLYKTLNKLANMISYSTRQCSMRLSFFFIKANLQNIVGV